MATPLNFTPGKYGAVFDYLDKQPSGISEYANQDLNQMADWQVPNALKDNLSLDYTPGFETEGGPVAGNWRYNTKNLPATKFGSDLSNVMLIRNQGDYDKLKNKNMAYYDPNYGFITTHQNYNDSSWEDYIPTAIMAAASAGFGSLVAPGLAAAFGQVPAQAGQMAFNLGKNYMMGSNNDSTRPTIQAQGNPMIRNNPSLDQYDPQNIPGLGMPNLDQYDPQNIPGQGMQADVVPTFFGNGPLDIAQPAVMPNTGGSGLGNIFSDAVNWFTNGGLTSPAGYLAGIGMATKQWNDADKWMDKTEQWAKDADPFGKYRAGYGDQLQRLNENPSEYLKTLPGYQAALDASSTQGIQRLIRGQQGMSNTINDITAAAGDVANKTYASESDRLAKLAGANIDPSTAARLRQAGLEGSIASQNAALGSLMAPFGSQMQQNGSGTGSGGGGIGDLIRQVSSTAGPAAAAKLAQFAKDFPELSPAQLLGLLKMPNASVGGISGDPSGVFTGHGDMPGDSYGPPSNMPSDPGADNPPTFDTDAPGTFPGVNGDIPDWDVPPPIAWDGYDNSDIFPPDFDWDSWTSNLFDLG